MRHRAFQIGFALLLLMVPSFASNAPAWRKLMDVFEPVRAIALETQDICLLSRITKVIHMEPYLFILDDAQGIIFQFDVEGRFVRIFGNVGEGPGEYLQPVSLFEVFDGNIATYDRGSGQIKVYNQDGNFVLETPRPNKAGIIPRPSFIWPSSDQLILADFSSSTDRKYWHLITDAEMRAKDVLFGQRQPSNLPSQRPMAFSQFLKVGDHIWAGSPYDHHINIYTLDGQEKRQFKQPNASARPGAYPEGAYVELPDGRRILLSDLKQRQVNSGFAYFAPYVITRCAFVVNVFDTDFNHLKSIAGGGFHYLNDNGAYAIKQAPDLTGAQDIGAVDPREQLLLEATDWKTSDHGEVNPYLTFWKPIE